MDGQVESPGRDESRDDEPLGPSRRSFVGGVIASVGAASVVGGSRALARTPERGASALASAEGPMGAAGQGSAAANGTDEGSSFEGLVGRTFRGCRVERVATGHLGGSALVLRDGGSRFQIDVLARSDEAVAHTALYSLYLANRGDGRRTTVERHGLALMDVAQWLRAREGALPPLADATLAERQAAHPRGNFLLP